MQLKVVNCPDRDFKPYVERAALFYAKQLIPDGRLRNRCFTKIRFDAKIEEQGYCSVEEYNSRNQPREFLIEIHPGIGARNILSTLAHEMVHARQFLRRHLVQKRDGKLYWKGVQSDNEEWEDEAYVLEERYYKEYVNERTE